MKRAYARGFTIVELLVVIVVIGILAAITIISYAGISNRAVQASLQSDLSNASVQLKLFLAENNVYPGSISDCPTPASTNLCLKASTGNTYSSYSVNNSTNPPTYTLSALNGSNIYEISSTNQTPTSLASAPLNPVADWLATTQGDHYGNFYDLVSHQYATVTRSTTKTIYDPNTQKIYDVPANTLGIRPRSDGKSGSEAEIEEGRTNYLINSYGSANDGNKWTTGWSTAGYGNLSGAPTFNLVPSVYGTTALRSQYTASGSDSYFGWSQTVSGGIVAGNSIVFSVYVKGTLSNPGSMYIQPYIYVYDSSNNLLGSSPGAGYTPTSNWNRVSVNYINLPSGTDHVRIWIGVQQITAGRSFDYSIAAAQLEKVVTTNGYIPTSYIPTTATSATRNGDSVSVSAGSFNVDSGTVFCECNLVNGQWYANAFDWYNSYNNQLGLSQQTNSFWFWGGKPDGVNLQYASQANNYGYSVFAGSWQNNSPIALYINNTKTVSTTNYTTFPSMPATALIGSNGSPPHANWNGPIQRIVVYSSTLSDSDVSTVTNAIKDGP